MQRLDGYLYARSGAGGKTEYQYRRPVFVGFSDNGKRKYQEHNRKLGSVLHVARAQAKRLDAWIEARQRGETPRQEQTVGEFIGWYVPYMRDQMHHRGWFVIKANVEAFARIVGSHVLLSRLTRLEFERFLAVRGREVKPSTLCGAYRDVRRMVRVAVEQGCMESDVMAAVRKPRVSRTEPKVPTDSEVQRIIGYLKTHHQPLYRLVLAMLHTCARPAEALGLTWDRIDFVGNTLTLVRRKVNDELPLVMAERLGGVLAAMWRDAGMPSSGPVFLNGAGKPWARNDAGHAFKGMVARVGLPWVTLKTFRKVGATWVQQGPGGQRAAQLALGHTDPRTTQLYLGGGAEMRALAVRTIEERAARRESDTPLVFPLVSARSESGGRVGG